MIRPLPLWLAAVLPSMIVGHALAYAFGGRSAAANHHAWVLPVLEGSLALTLSVGMALMGGAFVRARVLAGHLVQRSLIELWPRLAVCQVLLFCGIERAEGTNPTVLGCVMQVLVALFAAYIISVFARVVAACSRNAEEAAEHLKRLFALPSIFLQRETSGSAFALLVPASSGRSLRAPPFATFR